MRIFLDANVLFSAAKTDGPVRKLLALLRAEGHELYADPYVIEEARRNITLKYPDAQAGLHSILRSIGTLALVRDVAVPDGLDLPDKDRPVLAAAIHHRCDVLVTGDKSHFGALFGSIVEGTGILSPAQAATKLLS